MKCDKVSQTQAIRSFLLTDLYIVSITLAKHV